MMQHCRNSLWSHPCSLGGQGFLKHPLCAAGGSQPLASAHRAAGAGHPPRGACTNGTPAGTSACGGVGGGGGGGGGYG